jgi:hypothetical protein
MSILSGPGATTVLAGMVEAAVAMATERPPIPGVAATPTDGAAGGSPAHRHRFFWFRLTSSTRLQAPVRRSGSLVHRLRVLLSSSLLHRLYTLKGNRY